MSRIHVFVASGDSCPICLALAGESVEPGYRPHESCTCNTVLMDDGETVCEFDYEEDEAWLAGPRWRISLTLTITCPDGSVHTVPGAALDLETMRSGDNDDLLESLAHEACDEECDGEQESEFLCC